MFNKRNNTSFELPNFGFSTGPAKNNRNNQQRNKNQGGGGGYNNKPFGGNNNGGGYQGGLQSLLNNLTQQNFKPPQNNYGNQLQNNYDNQPQNNYGNQPPNNYGGGNQRKPQFQNSQQRNQNAGGPRNQQNAGGPRNQNTGGQRNQNQRVPRNQQQNFNNQQFQGNPQGYGNQPLLDFNNQQPNYGNPQQNFGNQQQQNGYRQQNNQGFNSRKRKSNPNFQGQNQNQGMANSAAPPNNQNYVNKQPRQQSGVQNARPQNQNNSTPVKQQRQNNVQRQNYQQRQNQKFNNPQGGNKGPNESDVLLKELGKCLLGSITGNNTGANPMLQNQVMGLMNRPVPPPMQPPVPPMYPPNFNMGPLLPGPPPPMAFGPSGPIFSPRRPQMGSRRPGQQVNKGKLRANNKRVLKPKNNKTGDTKTKRSAIDAMIAEGKDLESDDVFVPFFLRKMLYNIYDLSFKNHANFLVLLFYTRPNNVKLFINEIKRFLDQKVGNEKENIKAKKELLLKAKVKFDELFKERQELIKSKETKMNELIDILSGEKFTKEHETTLQDYKFDDSLTDEDYTVQLKLSILKFIYERFNLRFATSKIQNFQKYVDYTMQNKIISLIITNIVQNNKLRTVIPKNLQTHLQYLKTRTLPKKEGQPSDGYFFSKLLKNENIKVKTEISEFMSKENPLSTEVLRDFAECLLKFDEKACLAKLKTMYFTPHVALSMEDKLKVFDNVIREIYQGCIDALNKKETLFGTKFPDFIEDKVEPKVKTETEKTEEEK